MRLNHLTDLLFGEKASFRLLFIATVMMLFTFLGARELWTQEHRWADVVMGMFYRHDFFHPYLGDASYYDKPLLSYWLIALFIQLTGIFSEWALRIPSALSGLLAIWSIYRLGVQLKNKQLGLLAGWLLLTTFYFIFWARTSSADMLNLAGSLYAISWYMDKRNKAVFYDYAIFFLLIALTSLCKGLIGAVVPLFAVLVDVILQKSWKQHVRFSVLLAMVPATIIYLLPFFVSAYVGGEVYHQSGLYLVYRENVLRYFQPFDHRDPFYIYFIYLPIYSFPWAIFLAPALFHLKSRWKAMSLNSKWIVWTLFSLFLFLTLSGSRRSYYVLPLVPFAILFVADWLLSAGYFINKKRWPLRLILFSFVFFFIVIDVLPAWYYSQYGVAKFAALLKAQATKIKPWEQWNVVILDGESKLNFYLKLPPTTKNYRIRNSKVENAPTTENLLSVWPVLKAKSDYHTIFISDKYYEPALKAYFAGAGYQLIEGPERPHLFSFNSHVISPIAFIPSS